MDEKAAAAALVEEDGGIKGNNYALYNIFKQVEEDGDITGDSYGFYNLFKQEDEDFGELMDEKAAAVALEETGQGCGEPEKRAVAPWLVKMCYKYDEEEDSITGNNYAFYNIFKSEDEYEECGEYVPELSNTTFYHKPSHQGWLIVLCSHKNYDYTVSSYNYGDCFLWNPTTKETIQLPTLLEFYKVERGAVQDCVLSSPPHAEDSLILLYCSCYNDVREDWGDHSFLFCLPGETKWRIHKLSPDIVEFISRLGHKSVLCFKGKLYLMCTDDRYEDHHLEIEHFTKDTDLTISVKPFHVKKDVLFPFIHKFYPDLHYVESQDELYRVDIIKSSRSFEVISIEVVRLNCSLMEWEKVHSFGDNVLFIGNQTTACISAAELGFNRGCLLWYEGSLHKFEIEGTGNTVSLQGLCPTDDFYKTSWVIMPLNGYGRVKNKLGSKHEENGFSVALETSTIMVVNDENQGGKCSATENGAASYWNNLNGDIVRLIANHLLGLDYTHFRSVCKENREIIPEVKLTSYSSPWLVFSRDHNSNIFSVVNPIYNNENYVMNLSGLAGSTIRFQKGGWLLMTREHNIFFYSPFTRETVKLPDMQRVCRFSVVSFSSLPTSIDCIVFAMDVRRDGFHIDFIRKGEAHWSSRIFDHSCISNIFVGFLETAFFHDDAFFYVDYYLSVGVFNAKDNSWKVVEQPRKKCQHDSGYLVECAGDLLMVKVNLRKPSKKSVKILKLNFSEMEWVKLESLGEHMLFISCTSCVSAVAPEKNMKNNIYFPRLHLDDGGIVFYSLETRSYHSLRSKHSAYNLSDTEGWFRNCTWIEPNRSMSTSEELDWLKTPLKDKY